MNNHVLTNVRHCGNAVCLSREFLSESKMSLEAKGLLATLMAFPTEGYDDEETYDLNTLIKHFCKEDESVIHKILIELEEFGYIEGSHFYQHKANSTIYIYDGSLCDGRFNDWTKDEVDKYIHEQQLKK